MSTRLRGPGLERAGRRTGPRGLQRGFRAREGEGPGGGSEEGPLGTVPGAVLGTTRDRKSCGLQPSWTERASQPAIGGDLRSLPAARRSQGMDRRNLPPRPHCRAVMGCDRLTAPGFRKGPGKWGFPPVRWLRGCRAGPPPSNPGLSLFLPVVPGWSPPAHAPASSPARPPRPPTAGSCYAALRGLQRLLCILPPLPAPSLKGAQPASPPGPQGPSPSGFFLGVLVWTGAGTGQPASGPPRLPGGGAGLFVPLRWGVHPLPGQAQGKTYFWGTPCQGSHRHPLCRGHAEAQRGAAFCLRAHSTETGSNPETAQAVCPTSCIDPPGTQRSLVCLRPGRGPLQAGGEQGIRWVRGWEGGPPRAFAGR